MAISSVVSLSDNEHHFHQFILGAQTHVSCRSFHASCRVNRISLTYLKNRGKIERLHVEIIEKNAQASVTE